MAVTVPTPADLKKLDFFSSLDAIDLAQLASRAHLRRLDAGSHLFTEGEPLEPALRFVYKGGLEIRKTAASGKETVVRLLGAGELFGVAAMFDRKVAPGTAIATGPTEVLEIHMDDMLAQLTQNPRLAMKLLVTFSQRLREMQDTLHTVVSGRAKTRLARQILAVLDQQGAVQEPEGLRLKAKLPHATLSRMVGITYEECVRLIRDWAKDPAILRYERGGVVTILDREALVHQAQDD